jgi:hypothetical protein
MQPKVNVTGISNGRYISSREFIRVDLLLGAT